MATTQDYINQLKIDKQNLVNMLNSMGVEASDNETFTSLIPKIRNIKTDEPTYIEEIIDLTKLSKQNISILKGGSTNKYEGWYLYESIDVSDVVNVNYMHGVAYNATNGSIYIYGIVFYDENNNFISGIGTDEVLNGMATLISPADPNGYFIQGINPIPNNAKYMRVATVTIGSIPYIPRISLSRKVDNSTQ